MDKRNEARLKAMIHRHEPVPAADIKRGMVVEYQGQRIAVSHLQPGIHVQTIADEGWVHMIRVPWDQTVAHLHNFEPRERH